MGKSGWRNDHIRSRAARFAWLDLTSPNGKARFMERTRPLITKYLARKGANGGPAARGDSPRSISPWARADNGASGPVDGQRGHHP